MLATSATVSGNLIVRSGGKRQSALRIGIDAAVQVAGDVASATVTGNTIVSSTATTLANNTITSLAQRDRDRTAGLPAPSGCVDPDEIQAVAREEEGPTALVGDPHKSPAAAGTVWTLASGPPFWSGSPGNWSSSRGRSRVPSSAAACAN